MGWLLLGLLIGAVASFSIGFVIVELCRGWVRVALTFAGVAAGVWVASAVQLLLLGLVVATLVFLPLGVLTQAACRVMADEP